jgi:myosin-7
VTSWEYPSAHGDVGALSPVAPKKKLSLTARAQWRKILDFARQEATTVLQTKQKRFLGIRKFGDIVNKRKAEAAANKAKARAEDDALNAKIEAAASAPKRSIMEMLEVDVPPIDKYSVEEFAENAFNLNRKGFFAKKTTVAKALSWKNELIKTSLLKMPTKDLENQAILCFRNVTGFMGDRDSKKEESGHAEKILRTCLNSPEELRDEVFCQVLKQTINNPSPESTLKGWMLLGVITGAISPSRDFEKYLLSYCQTHTSDPAIGEYAKYSIGRVIKTAALPPRGEVPTPMEVEAAKMRLPVLLRVYHLDGTYDMLPMSSWVTPALLKAMVCEKRGINNSNAFGIYEMTPEGEERFLEPEERLLDLVAYWQRLFEEERAKTDETAKDKRQRKRAMGSSFYRVVFKVHMYFDVPTSDRAATHEMFAQANFDVVSARYPCGERDCVALAALQLQAEYGDAGLSSLASNVVRFLPAKYAEGTRTNELAADIMRAHAEHSGKSTAQVEKEYLEYVQEWQVYGSSFFFVEPQMNADLPEEVFLAINPKGILIINPETKEVLSTYPYNEVPTWGHSQSSFVLHIGNLVRQSKIYFATEQGREINELVRAYVNDLCAKQ